MNKKILGLIVTLTMVSGCQTANKSTQEVSAGDVEAAALKKIDSIESIYGYRFTANDRSPSSVEPIVGLLFKKLANKVGQVGAKKEPMALDAAFRNFADQAIRDSKEPELKSYLDGILKNRKGKDVDSPLTSTELKELDNTPSLQIHAGRIAESFYKSLKEQDQKNLKGLFDEVAIKYSILKNDVRTAKGGDLLETNVGNTSKFDARMKKKKFDTNSNEFVDDSERGLRLKQVMKKTIRGAPEADKKELAEVFDRIAAISSAIWKRTGMMHFVDKTCEFDLVTLKEYEKFLISMRDDIETNYAKNLDTNGRIKCKNLINISAWAAGKYQAALGRVGKDGKFGVSTWIAVNEMAAGCNLADNKIAGQALLNSQSRNIASTTDAPKCIE